MSNGSNPAIARQFFSALQAGDRDQLVSLICDEFEWTVVARSLDFGTQRGVSAIDTILEGIRGTFRPGSVQMKVVRSACEGNSVVLEIYTTATTQAGTAYDNWYVNWLELKDGKVLRWSEYTDTKYATDLLSGETG